MRRFSIRKEISRNFVSCVAGRFFVDREKYDSITRDLSLGRTIPEIAWKRRVSRGMVLRVKNEKFAGEVLIGEGKYAEL